MPYGDNDGTLVMRDGYEKTAIEGNSIEFYEDTNTEGTLAGALRGSDSCLEVKHGDTDDPFQWKRIATVDDIPQVPTSISDLSDGYRIDDIEEALSVVESETADATDYTTETTSVSTDNITINPVAVRRSTIYSVYKQGGGQESIKGVFSPGYTNGSYILNVQIAQAGTVSINSIRTRYYSGYYPIVYFYFTPTGGEKVKVAEIAKASAGTASGNKYEEPTVSVNVPGAGVLSIELWLYDIDTYNTIPAFYWMEYESSSVVYYAITSISFDKSSLTGFVNNGAYNSTTKKIELKHDNDILAEIDATAFIKDGMVDNVVISNGYINITFNTDAGKETIPIPVTDIFDPSNYYDKADVDGLLAGKADSADLAEVATSGSYNDLSDQPTLDDLNKVEDLYALDATNSDWKRKVDKMFDDGTLPPISKTFDYCNLRIYSKNASDDEYDSHAINSLETTEEGLTFADGTHFSSYKIGAKYYVGYLSAFFINEGITIGNIEITCTKSGILKLYLYKCAITEDAYFHINGQPTTVKMPTTETATILTFDVNEGDVISVSPTTQLASGQYYDFGLVGMSFYSKYPVSRFTNDAGYLTEHQSLTNYYTKSETYTKTEVDNKIGDIETLLATI